MSKNAYQVLLDGNLRKVSLDHITRAQARTAKYLCCGQVNGVPCMAALDPVFRANAPYFRVHGKHIVHCPNDQSSNAKLISHLDVTGDKTTLDDLLADLSDDSKSTASRRADGDGIARPHGDKDVYPEVNAERSIDRTGRNPRTLKEFVVLLSRLDRQARYANIIVNDILIDDKNIRRFRCGPLPQHPVVVFCSKMSEQRIAKILKADDRSHGGFVLEDAYAYRDRFGLLFICDVTDRAKMKICKAPKDHYVIIFAAWTHVGGNLYRSKTMIASNQVFIAAKDFLDQ